MSIQAILMPMFVQVALTFVLLFWMGVLRLPRHPIRRRSKPEQIGFARAPLAAARAPDRQRLP